MLNLAPPFRDPGGRCWPARPLGLRAADPAPGTHEIQYRSAIDTITIQHEAHSREGFARGALAAARWIVGRAGVFGMPDMLGF